MNLQDKIVHRYPSQVAKIILALQDGPLTWSLLRAATGISQDLLRLVLTHLEAEETIDRGYEEQPSFFPRSVRYWLT